MIDAVSALLRWLVVVALIAAAAHFATVAYMPTFLMARAMERLEKAGGINQIVHAEPATPASRTIVRPSPDLIYSSCVFNLTQNDVLIRAPVPKDGYWSISLYAANTDNFFVVNNSAIEGDVFEARLVGPGSPATGEGDMKRIVALSFQGILLIRALNEGGEAFAAMDAARREAICTQTER